MSLKANKGDLIQYRYRVGGFTQHDTRFVEMIEAEGYWVQGGYFVAKRDVLTVIPMHADDGKSQVSGSKSKEFPLEAGQ